MYLPVPGIEPMFSVFLGECVTYKAIVADTDTLYVMYLETQIASPQHTLEVYFTYSKEFHPGINVFVFSFFIKKHLLQQELHMILWNLCTKILK